MLRFYLLTVAIWMIIINSALFISCQSIIDRGWRSQKEYSGTESLMALFALAAIPFIRVLFLFVIFLMATKTPEEFEEMIEGWKNGRN